MNTLRITQVPVGALFKFQGALYVKLRNLERNGERDFGDNCYCVRGSSQGKSVRLHGIHPVQVIEENYIMNKVRGAGYVCVIPRGCGGRWKAVQYVIDEEESRKFGDGRLGIWAVGRNGEGKLVRSFFEFCDYGRAWIEAEAEG